MPLERVVAVASRFLSDRTFMLIVAPAIADFQFDAERRLTSYVAVLRAVAGGAYEDLTSGTGALTFLGLALLPAAYYSFFFLLCAPALGRINAWGGEARGMVAIVALLSVAPALACYWPERRPRHDEAEHV
jgi:hypothetical protein